MRLIMDGPQLGRGRPRFSTSPDCLPVYSSHDTFLLAAPIRSKFTQIKQSAEQHDTIMDRKVIWPSE